jgi:hypothetical protein
VLRLVPFKRAWAGAFRASVPVRVDEPSKTIEVAEASANTGADACSTLPDCCDCKYTQ